MQDPKGVRAILVTLLVWLQALNGCLGVWCPGADLTRSVTSEPIGSDYRSSPLVDIAIDREFRTPGDVLREWDGISLGEGESEVVKARAKIVQRFPD
jgi:hypothetical protein